MRIAVMRWKGSENMRFVQTLAQESGVPLHIATVSGLHYVCLNERFESVGECGLKVAKVHRAMERLELGKGRIFTQEMGRVFLTELELVLNFENLAQRVPDLPVRELGLVKRFIRRWW